jgi:hypothetical protein
LNRHHIALGVHDGINDIFPNLDITASRATISVGVMLPVAKMTLADIPSIRAYLLEVLIVIGNVRAATSPLGTMAITLPMKLLRLPLHLPACHFLYTERIFPALQPRYQWCRLCR